MWERLNIVADTHAKAVLQEAITQHKDEIKTVGNRNILGRVQVNSPYLSTTIVSNLKHELREYLVKIQVMKHQIEYGKDFLVNNRANIESFAHATRNIDS